MRCKCMQSKRRLELLREVTKDYKKELAKEAEEKRGEMKKKEQEAKCELTFFYTLPMLCCVKGELGFTDK